MSLNCSEHPDPESDRYRSKRQRILIVLLCLPVAVIASAAYSGMHAALFGAETAEISHQIVAGAQIGFLFGIIVGVVYIFSSRRDAIRWPVIGVSAALWIFPFAVLYPWLPEDVLRYLAKPLEHPSFSDPKRLMLVGGLNGVFFGGIVGFLMGMLSPKTTSLRHIGLVRYLVLSILIASLLIGKTITNETGASDSFIVDFLYSLLLSLLMVGIWWWDNWRH